MRQTINGLHDRVNRLVGMLLFESTIRRALDSRQINVRQYNHPFPPARLRTAAAARRAAPRALVLSLYLKLNDKTPARPAPPGETGLAHLDTDNALWLVCHANELEAVGQEKRREGGRSIWAPSRLKLEAGAVLQRVGFHERRLRVCKT